MAANVTKTKVCLRRSRMSRSADKVSDVGGRERVKSGLLFLSSRTRGFGSEPDCIISWRVAKKRLSALWTRQPVAPCHADWQLTFEFAQRRVRIKAKMPDPRRVLEALEKKGQPCHGTMALFAD